MSELFVRTTLPDLGKAELFQNRNNLARFENGDRQMLRHSNGLDAHELGLQIRWTVFE